MPQHLDELKSAPDREILAALAMIMEREGADMDMQQLASTHDHVLEALGQPELLGLIDKEDPTATTGSIGRIALQHIAATRPDGYEVVSRALNAAQGRRQRDVSELFIGAMVLYAFSTDIKLSRDARRGWSFSIHHAGIGSSTLVKLLGQLYELFIRSKS